MLRALCAMAPGMSVRSERARCGTRDARGTTNDTLQSPTTKQGRKVLSPRNRSRSSTTNDEVDLGRMRTETSEANRTKNKSASKTARIYWRPDDRSKIIRPREKSCLVSLVIWISSSVHCCFCFSICFVVCFFNSPVGGETSDGTGYPRPEAVNLGIPSGSVGSHYSRTYRRLA
jgi:hypothetical protein